ncbi:family 43 glycosylhydrolase [Dysgonomonas macrotermitis]|uniref:Glycosyl hydrolases family 43 n=1 Tax=Dysgonomonas macrotermitis TaxID=1346286 RepID=A0A1M4TLM6_9BACT|nr:family 43 glycosylhydrolase [Dysgonomonas macrotermitis]SHE45402.1 Glycosyl hydrolases family 43 [Dysgonomonas macrotermitis]
MKLLIRSIYVITMVFLFAPFFVPDAGAKEGGKTASKPLFRDTKYDGAADPVIIWNKKENCWFMFYTNRRANLDPSTGVDWVHGTPIGIAKSTDGGASWQYRGDAVINYGEKDYTYWAPDVIEYGGKYHMFLTVVPGIFTDWKHPRSIVQLESDNLINWVPVQEMQLASDKVIDAGVFKAKNGWWYMYYNNEKDRKSIYAVKSMDMVNWEDAGKVVGDKSGEGPKVFYWHDRYFMIVDNWDGLGVYSSPDLKEWVRQPDNILKNPGKGKDDETKGLHADVVVNEGKAYIFYFTHPGRKEGVPDSYETRRSSIQVAELEYKNGAIVCDRDKEVKINLKP